ncbi:MAG TPA: hypothetical protein VGI20_01935 [Rhizomicrobium sp.]|jgi:hypothetical protein
MIMRFLSLIALLMLIASVDRVEAFGGPQGVWVSGKPDSMIRRIHISGSPLSYMAMIDYRCAARMCSTLQSLAEDDTRSPPLFLVDLESADPARVLALRWQKGPPCNRVASDDNPLAFWTAPVDKPGAPIHAIGRVWCFVRPRGSTSSP